MNMNSFLSLFDATSYKVFLVYASLIISLLTLQIPPTEKLFILINVIVYVVITSMIFFTHTKYESKNIKEKYAKESLSIAYDLLDDNLYQKMIKNIPPRVSPSSTIHPIYAYSTLLLCVLIAIISSVYYYTTRDQVKISHLFRGSYYLFALGLTEIFISTFVMSKIPYPDIANIIDVSTRKALECNLGNIIKLSPGDVHVRACHSFADNCHTESILDDKKYKNTFTCQDNRLFRTTQAQ
jgi:hypothetical protein